MSSHEPSMNSENTGQDSRGGGAGEPGKQHAQLDPPPPSPLPPRPQQQPPLPLSDLGDFLFAPMPPHPLSKQMTARKEEARENSNTTTRAAVASAIAGGVGAEADATELIMEDGMAELEPALDLGATLGSGASNDLPSMFAAPSHALGEATACDELPQPMDTLHHLNETLALIRVQQLRDLLVQFGMDCAFGLDDTAALLHAARLLRTRIHTKGISQPPFTSAERRHYLQQIDTLVGALDDEATEGSAGEASQEDDGRTTSAAVQGTLQPLRRRRRRLESGWDRCRADIASRWEWLRRRTQQLERSLKLQNDAAAAPEGSPMAMAAAPVAAGLESGQLTLAQGTPGEPPFPSPANEGESCARERAADAAFRPRKLERLRTHPLAVAQSVPHVLPQATTPAALRLRATTSDLHFHPVLSMLHDVPWPLLSRAYTVKRGTLARPRKASDSPLASPTSPHAFSRPGRRPREPSARSQTMNLAAEPKGSGTRVRTDSMSGSRRHVDHDIDNIMIPADFAPSKVETVEVKEISTPLWRAEATKAAVNGPQQNAAVEDISDAAFVARHQAMELKERERYLSWTTQRKRKRSSEESHAAEAAAASATANGVTGTAAVTESVPASPRDMHSAMAGPIVHGGHGRGRTGTPSPVVTPAGTPHGTPVTPGSALSTSNSHLFSHTYHPLVSPQAHASPLPSPHSHGHSHPHPHAGALEGWPLRTFPLDARELAAMEAAEMHMSGAGAGAGASGGSGAGRRDSTRALTAKHRVSTPTPTQ